MNDFEIRIEELKKEITELKKVPVKQCSFCGLSKQYQDVELKVLELVIREEHNQALKILEGGK